MRIDQQMNRITDVAAIRMSYLATVAVDLTGCEFLAGEQLVCSLNKMSEV